MSLSKRLTQKGELFLRLLLALFLLVACTTKSQTAEQQKNNNTTQKQLYQELKTLKSNLNKKERINTKQHSQQKANRTHPVEKLLRGTIGGFFKLLLTPFAIATDAIESHAPNKHNSNFAAQTIALNYQEKEQQSQIDMYKQQLAGYIPAVNLEKAIADPDTPARALLQIDSLTDQINTLQKQEQKNRNLINKINPEPSRVSPVLIRSLAGILAGGLNWGIYNAGHRILTQPKAKKRALKKQLQLKSQEIKKVSIALNETQGVLDQKGSPENTEQKTRYTDLQKQKQQLLEDRKKITEALANKTYKQHSFASRIAQLSGSALSSYFGYLLAKKYTTVSKKELSPVEQQKLFFLEKQLETNKEQKQTLAQELQKINTTYQKEFGPPNKEVIPVLLAVQKMQSDLEQIKNHKALGNGIIFGNIMRYLIPIIQHLTGGVIPMNL